MDCALVENENLVERYLLGELSGEERVAFEEHFFECENCFEELENLRAIQTELARSAEEIHAEIPESKPRRMWFLAVGVAAALIAVGVGLRMLTPPTEMPPELVELARFEPPSYEPVRLRGATDEAQQRFRTAMEFYSTGDYVSAIPGLEEAAILDPNAPNISFFLGVSYLLGDRTSEGIDTLQHTVDLGDTVFLEEVHLLLAKAHVHRGEFDVAYAELEAVIDLDGDFAPQARALLDELSQEVPTAK